MADEYRVLEILDAASNYEKEVGRLDENSKGIGRSWGWAGNTNKAAGKKWPQSQRRKDSLHDVETKTLF